MGFVVFSKNTGRTLGYYAGESQARAQVTGHNRRAVVEALKGAEYVQEWDCCDWQQYEAHFATHYAENRWQYLMSRNY
jgi:hypothetical protein